MNDPLVGLQEQERMLFNAFRQASAGKNVDCVIGACINMLINVVRQMEPKRSEAEARWDLFFGRGKTLLLDKNYDLVTGLRRNVFPHTQVVKMPLHWEDDTIRG
jgi:hypothetical protein